MRRRTRAPARRPAAWGRVSAAAFLLAVGAAGTLKSQCPDGTPPPCGSRGVRAAAAPAGNTVAVLYFDNESPDTSDAYLADGLTEEITSRLGKIGRLVVTSHTTMERYRGDARPQPDALARRLGVAHLVNGSVRRSGHRVRVSVELIRPRDGVQLWADAYDRTDADLLAIEEEVARAVATEIAGRLLPQERATLAVRPTRSAEAYDHYLRGNFYLARRTSQDVARAIGEYQAAVRADSAFARAFARVALGWALFLDWGWASSGLTRDSMLALGLGASERALALDSSDAEGWMSRGYLLTHRYPRTEEGAVAAFERAASLDPGNAEVLHQYASALGTLGDHDGVMRLEQRAVALEPDRAISLLVLGDEEFDVGNLADAGRWLDSALAVDPRFYLAYHDRARVRWRRGDRAGAQSDAAAAAKWSPPDAPYWGECATAIIAARSGDTATALARLAPALTRLEGRAELPVFEGYDVGMALAAAGQRDRAFDVLERIVPRGALLHWMLLDPDFDPVRSAPRFRMVFEDSRPPGSPR